MPTLTIKTKAAYVTHEQWISPECDFPEEQFIDPGTVLEYLGHIVGGMVKVRHNGQEVIISPGATVELGG